MPVKRGPFALYVVGNLDFDDVAPIRLDSRSGKFAIGQQTVNLHAIGRAFLFRYRPIIVSCHSSVWGPVVVVRVVCMVITPRKAVGPWAIQKIWKMRLLGSSKYRKRWPNVSGRWEDDKGMCKAYCYSQLH